MDRASQVRRNTLLLAVAQCSLLVAVQGILTVGNLAIVDLTGRDSAAGLLFALFLLSAAAGALLFGRYMDRAGRRPGLVAGYGLVAVGGLAGAASVAAGSALGVLASAVPYGAGTGAAQLGRGAVADMHPPEQRGRAVGLLLAAGTVGAVGGPFLVAAVRGLADRAGWNPLVAPWFVIAGFALAGLAFASSLRPDPRDLAVDSAPLAGTRTRPPRELFALPPVRVALIVTAVSQMSMVAIMGVTPVVLDHHGGGAVVVSTVISGHLAGMYAFSPLFGALIDRWGRRPGLVAGALLSASGAILSAVLPAGAILGVALFLVGLGWSAAYVSVTAVISDLTEPRERAGALGFTDVLSSTASTVAALAGGIALELVGFAPIALTMTVLLAPVALLAVSLREPAPGRWDVARAT